MFIKLRDNLIINTEEVSTVEMINDLSVNSIVDAAKIAESINAHKSCVLTFRQGHKIKIDDMTVEELWNSGFKK